MKNPPSFQFYPGDFLSDLNVQSMTDEEVGIYIKALSHCWIEDGLEIGCPLVEGWFNQHPSIAKCFYQKDGVYRNKRLDEERCKQISWREKSKKGGLHSVENKRLLKGGSTNAQPMVNTSLSSLQSSSLSEDETKNIKGVPEAGPAPHVHTSKDQPLDPILEEFESGFWSAYPVKLRKRDALRAYRALRRNIPEMEIESGYRGYMDHLRSEKVHHKFDKQPMYPAKFLKDDNWREFIGFEYKPKL
jgi:uncharacterized protein YdaU (DUF1376 family)